MADFDPASDVAAGANAFGALDNARRTQAARNALARAYGSDAADIIAAPNASKNFLAFQSGRNQSAEADTSAALLPGAPAAQAAQTGERNANAANQNATAAATNAKTPFIPDEARANIAALKARGDYEGALAQYEKVLGQKTAVETSQIPANDASKRNVEGAQAGYYGAETARTTQQASDAQRAAQQAQALSVVNGAISERDNPHPGNLVQTAGQRAASFLTRLSPQAWDAMGVDPKHVQPVIQHLTEHPEDLDNFQAQLTGAGTGGLTQAGLQAAASMTEKGQPVSFGMGKQATALRTKVMNIVGADMRANGGAPADAGGVIQDAKARQKYVSDLSGTGPTSAGGKVQSANALLNHIDLLSEFSEQLDNGSFRKGNDLSQALAHEFGSVPPAQFEAQRTIVADELGRFLIARGGSLADREALKEEISKAASPQQLRAVIATYRSDMVGQLQSMAQQAHANGADAQFRAHLTPRVQAMLDQHGGQSAAAPQGSGWGNFRVQTR